MNPQLRALALALYEVGAIKFGEFMLKMHQEHPDAPKSPIYLNLRTASHPKNPGPLTSEIMEMVGEAMYHSLRGASLNYDCSGGIPEAGNPFVEALMTATRAHEPAYMGRIVTMHKEDKGGGDRRIDALDADTLDDNEKTVLLVDDLATKATTKLEAAKAVEEAGRIVAGFVVLVDREQGGVAELETQGYSIVSVFTLTELLDLYVEEGLIELGIRTGGAELQGAVRRVLRLACGGGLIDREL